MANHHAVHHAAAAAQAVLQHHAQVLQHAARDLIIAGTRDLHAAGAMLESERAAWNHHVVRADRHRWRCHMRHMVGHVRHARHSHGRHAHLRAIHHHCAHS